jgi:hypothetical protein
VGDQTPAPVWRREWDAIRNPARREPILGLHRSCRNVREVDDFLSQVDAERLAIFRMQAPPKRACGLTEREVRAEHVRCAREDGWTTPTGFGAALGGENYWAPRRWTLLRPRIDRRGYASC